MHGKFVIVELRADKMLSIAYDRASFGASTDLVFPAERMDLKVRHELEVFVDGALIRTPVLRVLDRAKQMVSSKY